MTDASPLACPEIIPLSIGRVDKSMTLSILKLPPTTAPVSAKAQAFDFALQALQPHSATFDFGEKTAFFLSLAPRSIGTAMAEAQAFGTLLHKEIYNINNLQANTFLYGNGAVVPPNSIFCDVKDCSMNITTIFVTSTIDASVYALQASTCLLSPSALKSTSPTPADDYSSTHPYRQSLSSTPRRCHFDHL